MYPRLQANLPQDVPSVGSQGRVLSRGTAEMTATANSSDTAARPNVHVQVVVPRRAQNVRTSFVIEQTPTPTPTPTPPANRLPLPVLTPDQSKEIPLHQAKNQVFDGSDVSTLFVSFFELH